MVRMRILSGPIHSVPSRYSTFPPPVPRNVSPSLRLAPPIDIDDGSAKRGAAGPLLSPAARGTCSVSAINPGSLITPSSMGSGWKHVSHACPDGFLDPGHPNVAAAAEWPIRLPPKSQPVCIFSDLVFPPPKSMERCYRVSRFMPSPTEITLGAPLPKTIRRRSPSAVDYASPSCLGKSANHITSPLPVKAKSCLAVDILFRL